MKAILTMVGLIVGCISMTVGVHVMYGLTKMADGPKMEKAYFPTHIRFSPWLVGIIAGYFHFKTLRNKSFTISKVKLQFFDLFKSTNKLDLIKLIFFD